MLIFAARQARVSGRFTSRASRSAGLQVSSRLFRKISNDAFGSIVKHRNVLSSSEPSYRFNIHRYLNFYFYTSIGAVVRFDFVDRRGNYICFLRLPCLSSLWPLMLTKESLRKILLSSWGRDLGVYGRVYL